jgi:hypothetical protein
LDVRAEVAGTLELERALKLIPEATSKRILTNALKKAAEPLAGLMKDLAPDDPKTSPPYDLKSSIAIGTETTASGREQLGSFAGKWSAVVYVGPTRFGYPQAIFMEFGAPGRNVPSQPYARPAWDSQQPYVLNVFKAELWLSIERAAKKYGVGNVR